MFVRLFKRNVCGSKHVTLHLTLTGRILLNFWKIIKWDVQRRSLDQKFASPKSTHVFIRAVGWEVAWNVNNFCVYVLPSHLCMLSNIADTVNKHKTTWAAQNKDTNTLYIFSVIKKADLIRFCYSYQI